MRITRALAASREIAIGKLIAQGKYQAKEIAAELQLSLSYVRNVIWRSEFRNMQVTPEERAHLLARRAAAVIT
ncbi:MAG: hypothetical protein ABIZ04_20930 [Opitutus sp.]